MDSLHDQDGLLESQQPSKDWEGRPCTRCAKGHIVPDPPISGDAGRVCCLACRYEPGDIVVLTSPNEFKGFVAVVVRGATEHTDTRFLDDVDVGPENYTRWWGQDALSLIKTGKRDVDLAFFGPEIVAQAVEQEMSVIEFLDARRGVKKAKVKSPEDLVMEALAKLLIDEGRKVGKASEVMTLLEKGE